MPVAAVRAGSQPGHVAGVVDVIGTPEEVAAKLARLPKWAQVEMGRLTANAEYWKDKATAGPEDSNTFVQDFVASKPLGESPIIQFWLDEKRVLMAGLVQRADALRLEIRVDDGSGAIKALPISGNTLAVDTETW